MLEVSRSEIIVGEEPAVAVDFQPVVQMDLVKIRGNELLAQLMGFRTQEGHLQSGQDRYQRLRNLVGVNTGVGIPRLDLTQRARDHQQSLRTMFLRKTATQNDPKRSVGAFLRLFDYNAPFPVLNAGK